MISRKKKGLKILFVSSEQTGFAKIGGLGEVMFSLPRALREIGHDARVFMPRYASINPEQHKLTMVCEGLEVPSAIRNPKKNIICNVLLSVPNGNHNENAPTYFLENQEYYEMRSNVYGYMDDRIRFALLSRGALTFLAQKSDWIPDVIVGADWITGWVLNILRTEYQSDPRLSKIATVYSIHNIGGNQGMRMHHRFIPEGDRDDGFGEIPDLFSPRIDFTNSVRRGILHADVINTVSPTHAKEILTEEFGEGVEGLLTERRDRLYGILNGIDYSTNDPSTDNVLAKNFSVKNINARAENKRALQDRFGLPRDENVFLIGIVARLTKQKGFNLLIPIIDQFFKSTGSQLVVVGTGEPEIMQFFRDAEKKYPLQLRSHLQFDGTIPREIFAGADAVLIPSSFEPCGLTQMEAMRYGAVPIARRIGGLADSVKEYSPEKKTGNGFLFDDSDPIAFLIALTKAFAIWQHPASWRAIVKNCMKEDFSWEHSAKEYEKLFRLAIRIRQDDIRGK